MTATSNQPAFDLNLHIARLLLDEPFFAALSRRMDKVKMTSIPTAGVRLNKDTCRFELVYNPQWFETCIARRQEMGIEGAGVYDWCKGTLIHEFMHIVLGHVTGRLPEAGMSRQWNIAGDLAINSDLMRDSGDHLLPPECCFPTEGPFAEMAKGLSAEAYYKLLEQQQDEQDEDEGQDDSGEGEGDESEQDGDSGAGDEQGDEGEGSGDDEGEGEGEGSGEGEGEGEGKGKGKGGGDTPTGNSSLPTEESGRGQGNVEAVDGTSTSSKPTTPGSAGSGTGEHILDDHIVTEAATVGKADIERNRQSVGATPRVWTEKEGEVLWCKEGKDGWVSTKLTRPSQRELRAVGGQALTSKMFGTIWKPQRVIIGGDIFRRPRVSGGGAFVFDCSGSMSVSRELIVGIVAKIPNASAIGYCDGVMFLLAKDGKVADLDHLRAQDEVGFGGNGNDGLALRWLAKQPNQLKVWISDGYVCGKFDDEVRALNKKYDAMPYSEELDCVMMVENHNIIHVMDNDQLEAGFRMQFNPKHFRPGAVRGGRLNWAKDEFANRVKRNVRRRAKDLGEGVA